MDPLNHLLPGEQFKRQPGWQGHTLGVWIGIQLECQKYLIPQKHGEEGHKSVPAPWLASYPGVSSLARGD